MINNGIDLVNVNRFKNISQKFLENNFTENELNYIKSKNNNIETIAGMFAAKEATLKSLGIAMNVIPMKDIEILHDNGRPYINLKSKLKKDYKFSLSISHDETIAIAFVIQY